MLDVLWKLWRYSLMLYVPNCMYLILTYTTANPFILAIVSSGSGDAAFLLLITLTLLLLLFMVISMMLSLLALSAQVVVVSLLEWSRDLRRWGWSLFRSVNWRGFRRNSSAPSSKHLSIQTYIDFRIWSKLVAEAFLFLKKEVMNK